MSSIRFENLPQTGLNHDFPDILKQQIENIDANSLPLQQAVSQGLEFVLQARILVTKDKDYDQNRGKTERDRKTGAENYQGHRGQWSH